MDFAEQEICQLTESIWSSVLGMDVARSANEVTLGAGERFLTGCVQITGEWEGAVILHCSAELAHLVGAIMFDVEPGDGTDDDVQDALGELTNMIAGNVKALLPGICYLSLPAVVEGQSYRLIVPGSHLVSQVPFECRSEPFTVMLLERDEEQPEEP